MPTVYVVGTPLTYIIESSDVSFNVSSITKYTPGSVVHTRIGRLFCDRIELDMYGKPEKVFCTIPSNRSVRPIP